MADTRLPDGRRAFVSTLPAGSGERRLALAVVLASVAIFVAAVPFVKVPLGQLWPFKVRGPDYDVIVTDTKMPRMDGPAFYRELARRMPALARRVVFVTGDLMDREKREWLDSIGNLTLSKPFDVNDVRRAVVRVLEAAQTSKGG